MKHLILHDVEDGELLHTSHVDSVLWMVKAWLSQTAKLQNAPCSPYPRTCLVNIYQCRAAQTEVPTGM